MIYLSIVLSIIIVYFLFLQTKRKRLTFSIYIPKTLIKIEGKNLMASLTNTTYVLVAISPINRLGGEAEVENIQWSTLDADKIELSFPDPDNLKICKVRALGPIGTATLNVSADVNLDPNFSELIEDFVAFEIRPAEATSLGIGVSEPIEQ
jgi:hypothetical protein